MTPSERKAAEQFFERADQIGQEMQEVVSEVSNLSPNDRVPVRTQWKLNRILKELEDPGDQDRNQSHKQKKQ